MAERAFPVIFAGQVTATAESYERLGFQRQYQLPPDGDPGYVGLRRGAAELAVVAADWPQQQYGAAVAAGVRFKIFIYVGDVDSAVEELRQRRGTILRDAMDMPWGERVAYVADPDGNPSRWQSPPTPTDRDPTRTATAGRARPGQPLAAAFPARLRARPRVRRSTRPHQPPRRAVTRIRLAQPHR